MALVGAAFVFGTTFVVVKGAIDHSDPYTFLAVRFLMGALVMTPLAWRRGRSVTTPSPSGSLVAHGVLAGCALVAGYAFQTVGLQHTTGSASAFITYLLVIMVAMFHALRWRRLPAPVVMVGVLIATAGLFLMSGGDRGGAWSLGLGEVLTLAGAAGFALHIMVLDEVSARHDTLRLHQIQLLVVGAACLVPAVARHQLHLTRGAWVAAAYTAVMASALAIYLQTWAQRHLDPTRTALLLMLEPVFAGMLGAMVGDHLGARGALGAAAILVGIALAELGPRWSAGPGGRPGRRWAKTSPAA